MSSYPAPTQNIEFFNPAFFTQDTTPLTLSDANKLYFKKSGGIITGAVSAPSLTLNGINVETRLLEIDENSNKLTDITYNDNTTSILNDLAVIGNLKIGSVTITEATLIGYGIRLGDVESTLTKITYEIFGDLTKINSNLNITGNLQLGTITNVGTTILDNKQKTTKITYDAGTSVTTIADTLKSSGTLIVGSQNYNASDEFSKLQNISRNASALTINDSIILTGTLDLPSFGNVDTTLLDFEEILTNISYDSGTSTTTITGDVNVTGNFELGTITDVEQKIIDVSNGITPFISYDATTGKIDVTKDLSLNNVTIGRRAYNSGDGSGIMVRTNLNPSSTDIFSGSIFEVRNVGNNSQLWVGQYLTSSGFNKFMFGYIGPIGYEGNPEYYLGKLDTDGSIVCTRLDVNGDTNITGNLQLGSITDVEDAINNAGTPFISYNTTTGNIEVEKNMDLSVNDLTCNFMRPVGSVYRLSQNFNTSYFEFKNGGHHIDSKNADGTGRALYLNYYANEGVVIGGKNSNSTSYLLGKLNITEAIGTAPTAAGGSLTLSHDDAGGTSSIVFKSKRAGTDYGYISYIDDVNGGGGTRSVLELGVKTNPGDTGYVDNIALMPSGFVGINTRTPQTMLDVNGDTNITGNLQLGSILDVEDAINNAGGVPSITYDEATETTTFGGNFVTVPQLTIRPANDLQNAVQEIYSKNGTAELKIGDDNGTTLTFNNILKSENGKATFYGNDGVSETKFMEYDPIYDKVNITKDMDLGGNVLYIDNLYIQEATGTAPIGQRGSITLIHDDPGGTSSIVFRSSRDPGIDHGYISYTDDYDGSTTLDRSLLEIGCKNDTGSTTIDNIALMPSGNVGINTRTPQAMLDVNGDISCNQMTMNNVYIGERFYNNTDGNGISIRTLNNPDLSGSIFDVRAFGLKASLYCGFHITSSGANPFYFGFINADSNKGNEGNPDNYRGKLDTDGSVDCTEIKVNSIPINSFTNYTIGTNYTFTLNWGRGNYIDRQTTSLPIISHSSQFSDAASGLFTCNQFGTYEITSTVIFRNTDTNNNGRKNPCIGIAINDDTSNTSGTFTAPRWELTPYNQTPFSVQYARMSEGKVCTLTAKRIHHFTNLIDQVSIRTYVENSTGDEFQDIISNYFILNATIQFKYIGNFGSIS